MKKHHILANYQIRLNTYHVESLQAIFFAFIQFHFKRKKYAFFFSSGPNIIDVYAFGITVAI